jgi:putative transposase
MQRNDAGSSGAPCNRKWLGHQVPDWVDHGIFFVTLNCRIRGLSSLTNATIWNVIRDAALHYHGQRWWIYLLLAMPDHLHGLLAFPKTESMTQVMADWKRFVAVNAGVRWQKGFFDHRLRRDESFDEKAHYIRMNPVRRGLAEGPESWPFVVCPMLDTPGERGC